MGTCNGDWSMTASPCNGSGLDVSAYHLVASHLQAQRCQPAEALACRCVTKVVQRQMKRPSSAALHQGSRVSASPGKQSILATPACSSHSGDSTLASSTQGRSVCSNRAETQKQLGVYQPQHAEYFDVCTCAVDELSWCKPGYDGYVRQCGNPLTCWPRTDVATEKGTRKAHSAPELAEIPDCISPRPVKPKPM